MWLCQSSTSRTRTRQIEDTTSSNSLQPTSEISTLRRHGTVITSSGNAATSPSLWEFRLPGTIKRIILRVWRELSRKVGLWPIELQLQRPEHGASSNGLLQSKTCSWLVTYRELGSRSFPKLPYRSEVSRVKMNPAHDFLLIINSPQLPTPRRALFSSNPFATLNGRGKSYPMSGECCC